MNNGRVGRIYKEMMGSKEIMPRIGKALVARTKEKEKWKGPM